MEFSWDFYSMFKKLKDKMNGQNKNTFYYIKSIKPLSNGLIFQLEKN